MVQQKETTFKKKALADLKLLRNRWFFKTQEVTIKGIPDILMCLNGFFIALELKRDGKARVEKLQWHNVEEITTRGNGVAIVVWPEIWDDVYAWLKQIDAGIDPRPRASRS